VRRVGAGVGSAANGDGGCVAGLGFGLVGVDSATAVVADLGAADEVKVSVRASAKS
jgi:hypothetical protein